MGKESLKVTRSVTLQPLASDHATIPRMEAIAIPFHMRYGSMICSKRLQSDRPKSWWMLVEAGATQAKTVSKATVLD